MPRYFDASFSLDFEVQVLAPQGNRQGLTRVNWRGPSRQPWAYNGTTINPIPLPEGLYLDWPLPPKGYAYPIILRFFEVDEVDNILTGQDRIYGAPGQAPTYGQIPNPRGYAYPIALRTWESDEVVNNLTGQDVIYGAAGEVPNVNLPLPPKGYSYPLSNRWWEVDELNSNLLSQDNFPPGQQLGANFRLVS